MSLRNLYEDFPTAAGKLVQAILAEWNEGEAIVLQLLRKSAHSILNWVDPIELPLPDDEIVEIPAPHVSSLCLAAALWRSKIVDKLIKNVMEEGSALKKLLQETHGLWLRIVKKVFQLRSQNKNVMIAVLSISPVFKARVRNLKLT